MVVLVFLLFLILVSWAIAYFLPLILSQADLVAGQLEEVTSQLETITIDLEQALGLQIHAEDLIAAAENNLNQMFQPDRIFRIIISSTTNIVWVVVIAITIFHLLRDWEKLRAWIFGFIPEDTHTEYHTLYDEIQKVWHSYLRGQLLIMFLLGLISGIGSAAIGLPNALLLGFLAGTLALIPSLGPATATVIAAIVAWTQGSSYLDLSNFWITLIAVGILQIAQLIEGFFLTPRIMSRRMNLHPGIVLIAIISTLFTFGALIALVIIPLIGTITLIVQFFYRKQAGMDPWPQEEQAAEIITE